MCSHVYMCVHVLVCMCMYSCEYVHVRVYVHVCEYGGEWATAMCGLCLLQDMFLPYVKEA